MWHEHKFQCKSCLCVFPPKPPQWQSINSALIHIKKIPDSVHQKQPCFRISHLHHRQNYNRAFSSMSRVQKG